MKTGTVAMIAVMLFGLAGLGADEPPKQNSTKSATTAPADRLEPFLRVVRQAEDVRTVMQTYARAQAVEPNSPELHRAYMRRMLKFGLPQIAHHAARELVNLNEADGVAWGLIGYIHGRRGELAEAFAATIRAAELLGDDVSILNNAGQLAAWHDLEAELPEVADSARRALDNLREQLSKTKPFDKAYEAVKVAYTRQADAAAEVNKKMAAATAEAEAVQRLAQDIDYRLQQLNDEIDYHQRLIDSLWRELRSGYTQLYVYRDSEGRYVYVPNYGRQYHREYLRERIRDEEREIEEIRLKMHRSAARVRPWWRSWPRRKRHWSNCAVRSARPWTGCGGRFDGIRRRWTGW